MPGPFKVHAVEQLLDVKFNDLFTNNFVESFSYLLFQEPQLLGRESPASGNCGSGHHFLGLEAEAAVQVVEVRANHRQEAAASGGRAGDEDVNDFILFIGLDQGLTPFEF